MQYCLLRDNMSGLVAQSVEHRPFKAVVQGSSPCWLTIFLLLLTVCELVAQSVEHRPFKAVVQGSSPCQLTIFFVFEEFSGFTEL